MKCRDKAFYCNDDQNDDALGGQTSHCIKVKDKCDANNDSVIKL